MSKIKSLVVDNIKIALTKIKEEDYISITDMIKAKDGDFFISDWLRNANTLDYIAAWETMNNPDFNYGEFAIIRQSAGSNSFKISVKELVKKTKVICIIAKTGRYGGTYAYKDIAFNFGMWISPTFQLYIVKEYQRLKEIESNQYRLEWNVKRILSKANYHVHTDAVKKYIILKVNYSKAKKWLLYADEADLLNIVLFGCTAKEWRESNTQRVLNGENIRDMASINELAILSNIESLNSTLIKRGVKKKDRFKILIDTVKEQKETLDKIDYIKSIKKLSDNTFIKEQEKQKNLSNFNQSLKKAIDNPTPKESKD